MPVGADSFANEAALLGSARTPLVPRSSNDGSSRPVINIEAITAFLAQLEKSWKHVPALAKTASENPTPGKASLQKPAPAKVAPAKESLARKPGSIRVRDLATMLNPSGILFEWLWEVETLRKNPHETLPEWHTVNEWKGKNPPNHEVKSEPRTSRTPPEEDIEDGMELCSPEPPPAAVAAKVPFQSSSKAIPSLSEPVSNSYCDSIETITSNADKDKKRGKDKDTRKSSSRSFKSSRRSRSRSSDRHRRSRDRDRRRRSRSRSSDGDRRRRSRSRSRSRRKGRFRGNKGRKRSRSKTQRRRSRSQSRDGDRRRRSSSRSRSRSKKRHRGEKGSKRSRSKAPPSKNQETPPKKKTKTPAASPAKNVRGNLSPKVPGENKSPPKNDLGKKSGGTPSEGPPPNSGSSVPVAVDQGAAEKGHSEPQQPAQIPAPAEPAPSAPIVEESSRPESPEFEIVEIEVPPRTVPPSVVRNLNEALRLASCYSYAKLSVFAEIKEMFKDVAKFGNSECIKILLDKDKRVVLRSMAAQISVFLNTDVFGPEHQIGSEKCAKLLNSCLAEVEDQETTRVHVPRRKDRSSRTVPAAPAPASPKEVEEASMKNANGDQNHVIDVNGRPGRVVSEVVGVPGFSIAPTNYGPQLNGVPERGRPEEILVIDSDDDESDGDEESHLGGEEKKAEKQRKRDAASKKKLKPSALTPTGNKANGKSKNVKINFHRKSSETIDVSNMPVPATVSLGASSAPGSSSTTITTTAASAASQPPAPIAQPQAPAGYPLASGYSQPQGYWPQVYWPQGYGPQGQPIWNSSNQYTYNYGQPGAAPTYVWNQQPYYWYNYQQPFIPVVPGGHAYPAAYPAAAATMPASVFSHAPAVVTPTWRNPTAPHRNTPAITPRGSCFISTCGNCAGVDHFWGLSASDEGNTMCSLCGHPAVSGRNPCAGVNCPYYVMIPPAPDPFVFTASPAFIAPPPGVPDVLGKAGDKLLDFNGCQVDCWVSTCRECGILQHYWEEARPNWRKCSRCSKPAHLTIKECINPGCVIRRKANQPRPN